MTFLEDEFSEGAYRKAQDEAKQLEASELAEFSARSRRKKRIYKRKKSEQKPEA